MDWKIGDVAVCVRVGTLRGDRPGNPPSLRLNAEYIIQNIYQCPKCKEVSFDVGLASDSFGKEGYMGTHCSANCTEYIPCKEVHWCSSLRFVKRKTKQEQLAEAIENEEYELAGELRDKIKGNQ